MRASPASHPTSTSTSQPQPQPLPPCHLLNLPIELRLQIYTYLLILPPYYKHSSHEQPAVHASILRTSRQIHHEASHLLYAKNTFLAHPSLLASFPRLRESYRPVREAQAVSQIRRFHVLIRLDCDLQCSRDEVTRAFSHKDEVVVQVDQASFLGAGCENLRVLEGVRGVGRVVIRGSTTGFEEYVEWLRGVMEGEGRVGDELDKSRESRG